MEMDLDNFEILEQDEDNFICINCKQPKSEHRTYEMTDWCKDCINKEGERLMAEDSQELGEGWEDTLGRLGCPPEQMKNYKSFTRPPKYMLRPEEYEQFGYNLENENE